MNHPKWHLQSVWLLSFIVFSGWGSSQALGQKTTEVPRVLMVTQSKGFVHQPVKRPAGELADSEVAMRQLALESKAFQLDLSQDAALDITKENLGKYDVVMFYTSGDLEISKENMDFFVGTWMKQPKHGFIGIHSSSDTLKKDPRYYEMIGGIFDSHPWGANTEVTIAVHEPKHPTMVPFGSEVTLKEEIYQYQHWQPKNVRVLMSLDMAKCGLKKPYHVPVAWVKPWGEGRIYYNNLGHRPDTWKNKAFLESILQAIRWIHGEVEGESAPNPEESAKQENLAKTAAASK